MHGETKGGEIVGRDGIDVWSECKWAEGKSIKFRGLKRSEKGGLRIEVSHVPLLGVPFGTIQRVGLIPSQNGVDKLNLNNQI